MTETGRPAMQPWFIPMFYVSGAVLGGLALPRIEQAYLSGYTLAVSVASAQALLSAASSGMMALTGIVFAMAFVMVQFSAIAYSPRLVLWFARDRMLFHALGAFTATFIYALFTLAWVDRGGSAKVPLFSMLLVGIMIIVSMLLFSRLMQRLGDLQIGNVLHLLGDQGRAVIGEMFRRLDDASAAPHPAKSAASTARLGRVTQTVKYFGKPRTVAKLEVDSLVALAREGQGTIVMACAVGDTLVEGSALLHVHDSGTPLPEDALRRAVHLKRERTFEQDPKYPIRLLVDIAIKALSPAINDPTTAVQTIDQLEDLLRRLGASELDTALRSMLRTTPRKTNKVGAATASRAVRFARNCATVGRRISEKYIAASIAISGIAKARARHPTGYRQLNEYGVDGEVIAEHVDCP
jgi:uncharacterized membrane protein